MPSVRRFMASCPNGPLFLKQTQEAGNAMDSVELAFFQSLSKESGGFWQGSERKISEKRSMLNVCRRTHLGLTPVAFHYVGTRSVLLGGWKSPLTYLFHFSHCGDFNMLQV